MLVVCDRWDLLASTFVSSISSDSRCRRAISSEECGHYFEFYMSLKSGLIGLVLRYRRRQKPFRALLVLARTTHPGGTVGNTWLRPVRLALAPRSTPFVPSPSALNLVDDGNVRFTYAFPRHIRLFTASASCDLSRLFVARSSSSRCKPLAFSCSSFAARLCNSACSCRWLSSCARVRFMLL